MVLVTFIAGKLRAESRLIEAAVGANSAMRGKIKRFSHDFFQAALQYLKNATAFKSWSEEEMVKGPACTT